MSQRNVAVVAGTRPELIKLIPVLRALRSRSDFQTTLVATAQHREMLDQVCSAFGIWPDIDLDLMRPDQTLADVTARVTTAVQQTLTRTRPDAVLVHGDTTTCLCSALAAFYESIPVGHVEAGLRTYDFAAPWPEEMNRRLTDPISRWCFAPTARAADNLRAERIPDEQIYITGNTAVDALELALRLVRETPRSIPELPDGVLHGRRLIVVTGHRRESFGEPLRELCEGLREVVDRFPDVVVVYPVHLNPNVQRPVRQLLGGHDRIRLIAPLEYLTFVQLLDRATLIVTDSGGIQEEAPTLRKPVLVTRQTTERPEAVELGLARVVGTSRTRIVEESSTLLSDADAYARMTAGVNPYGDGHAAERIVEILDRTLR
jgi:UDP-N-acetylglucosamine 2-epimerase (hydrolysing)